MSWAADAEVIAVPKASHRNAFVVHRLNLADVRRPAGTCVAVVVLLEDPDFLRRQRIHQTWGVRCDQYLWPARLLGELFELGGEQAQ